MSALFLGSPAISVASETSHSRFKPPAEESTSSEEPTFTTMRRKSLSDGVFGPVLAELCMRRCVARVLPRRHGGSPVVSSGWGRRDAFLFFWRRGGGYARRPLGGPGVG